MTFADPLSSDFKIFLHLLREYLKFTYILKGGIYCINDS